MSIEGQPAASGMKAFVVLREDSMGDDNPFFVVVGTQADVIAKTRALGGHKNGYTWDGPFDFTIAVKP